MRRLFVSAFVAMACSFGLHAQGFITTDMELPTQPMGILSVNGNALASEGANFSFKWMCFDEGQRTAVIHIEWPEFLEQYKRGRPNTKTLEFSYSGKEIRLVKGVEKGMNYYMVARGTTMCAMVAYLNIDGKAITSVQINNMDGCHLIDDVYLGMNVDELKDLTSRTMKYSSVKFLYNERNNKVYDLLWLGMRDTYKDFEGTQHAEAHAKEPYGRFWFDASGKLVKWYQWTEGSGL